MSTRKPRRAEPINKRVHGNGKTVYEFRVDVGQNPDGSRRRQRFTYSTLTEARREYRRITTEVAAGTHVARHATTVGEFLTTWLDGRRDIRKDTLDGYRHALKPVITRCGTTDLQKLTPASIDELVTWRLTEGRAGAQDSLADRILAHLSENPEGVTYTAILSEFGDYAGQVLTKMLKDGQVTRPKRGLYVAVPGASRDGQRVSERTVNTMLTVLGAALDDAVDQNLIAKNPARMVKRPKISARTFTRKELAGFWNKDQMAAFRAHVRTHRLYALWLLTAAGLRRSEVMGLEWSSVNFDAGTVTVEQGRVRSGDGDGIGEPKSVQSWRTLTMPKQVMDALRSLKIRQAEELLALGQRDAGHDLVARDEAGEPIDPGWYSEEFQRIVKAAGLPRIRLHDARHSVATVMLGDRKPAPAVAAWLGHSLPVLLKVYAHAIPDQVADVGAALFADEAAM